MHVHIFPKQCLHYWGPRGLLGGGYRDAPVGCCAAVAPPWPRRGPAVAPVIWNPRWDQKMVSKNGIQTRNPKWSLRVEYKTGIQHGIRKWDAKVESKMISKTGSKMTSTMESTMDPQLESKMASKVESKATSTMECRYV